jgi:opacity protein-like surface antigen
MPKLQETMMKKTIAALFVSAALMGSAHAEKVTGVMQSFDQIGGMIVLDNGKAYGVDLGSDDSSLIHPVATGASVVLTVDGGSGLVTGVRAVN